MEGWKAVDGKTILTKLTCMEDGGGGGGGGKRCEKPQPSEWCSILDDGRVQEMGRMQRTQEILLE